ncbi:MAG: hypothetical protein MI757_20855, partial [Pirellulales bacterium]|nr:hypothetical protein [Pirellulales bacterium]
MSCLRLTTAALIGLFLCATGPRVFLAQEAPKTGGDPVAATVNGDKIYRSEVLRTFFTTLKGKHQGLDAATRSKMLASILDEVIDQ